MKELTKAEEKVMSILWAKGEAVVRDLLDDFEEPKPSYTTVATVIRILEKKGFVAHKVYGTTYLYFPIVSQEAYSQYAVSSVMSKYFGGSLKRLVSFFAEKDNVSIDELDEVIKIIEQKKDELPPKK
jgi:predicted transcriptional regulator